MRKDDYFVRADDIYLCQLSFRLKEQVEIY